MKKAIRIYVPFALCNLYGYAQKVDRNRSLYYIDRG